MCNFGMSGPVWKGWLCIKSSDVTSEWVRISDWKTHKNLYIKSNIRRKYQHILESKTLYLRPLLMTNQFRSIATFPFKFFPSDLEACWWHLNQIFYRLKEYDKSDINLSLRNNPPPKMEIWHTALHCNTLFSVNTKNNFYWGQINILNHRLSLIFIVVTV